MKKTITITFLLIGVLSLKAQDENLSTNEKTITIACGETLMNKGEPLYVVNGVPITGKDALKDISPNDIISVNVLTDWPLLACYGSAATNGVVLINTIGYKNNKIQITPRSFKVYCIPNTNWVAQQDIYNALEAKVPSLRIQNKHAILHDPLIRLRGQEINTVIVDGVRYDASILSFLDPANIEDIRVAPSAAATNYFTSFDMNN